MVIINLVWIIYPNVLLLFFLYSSAFVCFQKFINSAFYYLKSSIISNAKVVLFFFKDNDSGYILPFHGILDCLQRDIFFCIKKIITLKFN